DGAAKAGDPEQYVRDMLDRGDRIMGFGHRVYRAYDPRATVLKRTAKELGSPRSEGAGAPRGAGATGRAGTRGGSRGGAAHGAAGEVARPPARDERRVLGRGRARFRGDPAGPHARDVRL